MKLTTLTLLMIVTALLMLAPVAHADTYSTYQTTIFYSASRQYFVEVTEKKHATLYLNGNKLKRIWSKNLAELPGDVIVSNDGSRVALIDRYYGNGHDPSATVVLILDEKGDELAAHPLNEVTDLRRVLLTTSTAHWYWGAGFTPDSRFLFIETFVKKCEGPSRVASEADMARVEECIRPVPYERLRFDASSGKMTDRSFLLRRTTSGGH